MAQTSDSKSSYEYLFKPDKNPTKTLDALLRGVANYVIEFVGNKEDQLLTPTKLAEFYKAVGGNYDSLFVDVPHHSLSWIYASLGCQHTLQPSNDDFLPPSIPALTPQGFVRWQSIEILLGPEEHVPFIQNAVRNFAIINPDTKERFPIDLPSEAFPSKIDTEIEQWHSTCAEKLRQRATPNDVEDVPNLPPRPKVKPTFAHVRPMRNEYFGTSRAGARPIPFQHVSGADARPVRPRLDRSPEHRARQYLAPEETQPSQQRSRRRSYPENLSPPPEVAEPLRTTFPPPPPGPPPNLTIQPDSRAHPSEARRHSHSHHPRSRRHSIISDTSTSSDDSNPSPKSRVPVVEVLEDEPRKRRSQTSHIHLDHIEHDHALHRPHSHSQSDRERDKERDREHDRRIRFRRNSPPRPRSPDRPPLRSRKERDRDREDIKRRSFPLPIPVDPSGKLSAPFMIGKKTRDRGDSDSARGSRSNSRGASGNNVRWKDLYGMDASSSSVPGSGGWRGSARASEEEIAPHQLSSSLGRRGSRDDRERERDRDVEHRGGHGRRHDRDRERDWEREREKERNGKVRGGGNGHARRSSHEDLGRRSSDRDRDREREERRAKSSYRERDRDRDRDMERERDRSREDEGDVSGSRRRNGGRVAEASRRGTSPVRGVDGRRYAGYDG